MAKNYYYSQGKYKVSKMIKGRKIHFGLFKTEEQARKAVDLFNELGWDKNLRWFVRSKVLEETLK